MLVLLNMTEANGFTKRFAIGDPATTNYLKIYVTVSRNDAGTPVRVDMHCGRLGYSEHALFCALSEMMTMALERGVPLADIAKRFRRVAFDPAGPTGDPDFPMATSILDYVGNWMETL